MEYKVTVVGAGNVGATTAQRIAEAELADVVMVDVLADLATGKALDMMEAAPVLGFNARIEGGGDYAPTAGSDICVVTSGLASAAGAAVALVAVRFVPIILPYCLALAAASFLYVAMADLIPGLHRGRTDAHSLRQIVLIAFGVATAFVFIR